MEALFGPHDAARWIAVPRDDDDKYSRGVVGFVTGSATYPGAAVLGVEAAARTGVGMIRYLGAGRPTRLVLQRRPEAVTADGRVQAWVLGSGHDPESLDEVTSAMLDGALAQGVPMVLDGGALGRRAEAQGPVLLTPHAGELSRLIDLDVDAIRADPDAAALRAARELDATVLLKGHTTRIAVPTATGGAAGRAGPLRVRSAPSWLATAGAGDALAGILGALLATHHAQLDAEPGLLAPLAATGAVLHGLAAERASAGGPLTILDLTAALPAVIAELLRIP
ncbi:MAG TPA: ADP/ATP-dependent (S)-NAD(P)H-hydrate dehydratase [Pseudolysinimonas sp.]|nr:ADP/ATP-dependent (S)-NAD(P)H-hydrate dehydratase [Pseudolysinimonas sp.]